MTEDVYDYLHAYGFSALDLDKMEKSNENIFFLTYEDARKIINFLEEKYLKEEDIINLINENPFMITEKNNRLEALDDIYYNVLNFDSDSLKEFIKNNSKAYTISPIELQKTINYLEEIGYQKEEIREFIKNNSQVINMKTEEFIKILKKG